MKRFVIRSLERANFDLTLTKFFASAARWMLLVLTGLAALSAFGVRTTSFAAGIMLLVFRPFKVGDSIQTAGVRGTVDEIALFTTSLDTFDNRRIIIPNSAIVGANIENVSHHARRRADFAVGTDYGADIDRTRTVIEEAVLSVSGALSDSAPQIVLAGLGGSSVDWEVRVWAPSSELSAVKQASIRAVKLALDAAGIGIPFPQMDVHMAKP